MASISEQDSPQPFAKSSPADGASRGNSLDRLAIIIQVLQLTEQKVPKIERTLVRAMKQIMVSYRAIREADYFTLVAIARMGLENY